jgi:hypothetical protein
VPIRASPRSAPYQGRIQRLRRREVILPRASTLLRLGAGLGRIEAPQGDREGVGMRVPVTHPLRCRMGRPLPAVNALLGAFGPGPLAPLEGGDLLEDGLEGDLGQVAELVAGGAQDLVDVGM